jgi:hypothetical protein
MKKIFLCIIITCNWILNISIVANNPPCNYITSGYYQKIAEAKLSVLNGNDSLAYIYLIQAEQLCPPLHASYYEGYTYTRLLIKYGNFDKAAKYMMNLISQNGYSLSDFKYFEGYKKMKKRQSWDSLKRALARAEKQFSPDTSTVSFFEKMLNEDQYYRIAYQQACTDAATNNHVQLQCTKDTVTPAFLIPIKQQYLPVLESIDNLHYAQIQDLIKERGFPLSSSFCYTFIQRSHLEICLLVLFLHFGKDKAIDIEKQLLYYIEKGECPPEILAGYIDKRQLSDNKLFIYGFYDNASPDNIYEFEKIDERRHAIGLPDYTLSKKIKEAEKREHAKWGK